MARGVFGAGAPGPADPEETATPPASIRLRSTSARRSRARVRAQRVARRPAPRAAAAMAAATATLRRGARATRLTRSVLPHTHGAVTATRALDRWHLDQISDVTGAIVALVVRRASFYSMLHFLIFGIFFDARVGKFGAAWMRAQTQYLTQAWCGSLCVRVPRTLQIFTAAQLQVALFARALGERRSLVHVSLGVGVLSRVSRLAVGGLEVLVVLAHSLCSLCSLYSLYSFYSRCSLGWRSFAPSLVSARSSFAGACAWSLSVCRVVRRTPLAGCRRVWLGRVRGLHALFSVECPAATGSRSFSSA